MVERCNVCGGIIRVRKRQRWTAAKRTAFLDLLAATGNIAATCRELDIWPSAAYKLRRTDTDFASAWTRAIRTGYDRLEAMLLAKAGAAAEDAEATVDAGAIDTALALQMLRLREARQRAQAAGTAKLQNRVKRATPEETDAAILKQLAVLDRRIKAGGRI